MTTSDSTIQDKLGTIFKAFINSDAPDHLKAIAGRKYVWCKEIQNPKILFCGINPSFRGCLNISL